MNKTMRLHVSLPPKSGTHAKKKNNTSAYIDKLIQEDMGRAIEVGFSEDDMKDIEQLATKWGCDVEDILRNATRALLAAK